MRYKAALVLVVSLSACSKSANNESVSDVRGLDNSDEVSVIQQLEAHSKSIRDIPGVGPIGYESANRIEADGANTFVVKFSADFNIDRGSFAENMQASDALNTAFCTEQVARLYFDYPRIDGIYAHVAYSGKVEIMTACPRAVEN